MTPLRQTLAHSSTQRTAIGRIAAEAENDPTLFAELMALADDKDNTVAWHAAWALEQVARVRPGLFEAYRPEIYRRAVSETRHGVQRLLLSIVHRMPTPSEPDTDLLDFCLDGIHSQQLSIAVRALCIKIACRMCMHHAPLADELRLYLEYGDGECMPTGVATARRNAIRTLELHSNKRTKRKKD